MDDDEQKIPPNKKGGSIIKRIRTYRYDVLEALRKQKQSLTGMVIAEKKKRESGQKDTRIPIAEKTFFTRNHIFIIGIIGSIVLLFLAVGIMTFVFLSREKPAQLPPIVSIRNLILTEVDKKISLERFSEAEVRLKTTQLKQETSIPVNGVLGIVFVNTIPVLEGKQEVRVTAAELLSVLTQDIPKQLVRTLNDSFVFGFYSFRKTEPFLILTSRFYDGAFLGMLQWERFMLDDLAPLFLIRSDIRREQSFEDVIIKNNDVRLLRGVDDKIILLYSFIDQSTIVITTDGNTFEEIVTRLKTPRGVVR